MGATCPHNFEDVGAPPPHTLDRQCRSFLFLFVFARELGSLPKNSGPNSGGLVLGRGYLKPQETFAPPNFKIVPAPLPI